MSDIRAEMMPDELPDRSEVSKFDHSKLKHVNVTEKVILPSKEGKPRSGFFFFSVMCWMRFVTESYIYFKSNKSACQWKSTMQLFFSPIKNYGEQGQMAVFTVYLHPCCGWYCLLLCLQISKRKLLIPELRWSHSTIQN